MRYVSFFAGVESESNDESLLSYEIGQTIAKCGFTMKQGGYGGLMEAAARGCKDADGRVVAVDLAGMDWGDRNPYIDEVIIANNMSERLDIYNESQFIIVYSGGLGTLYEACHFIHLFINNQINQCGDIKPIILVGNRSLRLLDFLQKERWITNTAVRKTDFIKRIDTINDLRTYLTSTNK